MSQKSLEEPPFRQPGELFRDQPAFLRRLVLAIALEPPKALQRKPKVSPPKR